MRHLSNAGEERGLVCVTCRMPAKSEARSLVTRWCQSALRADRAYGDLDEALDELVTNRTPKSSKGWRTTLKKKKKKKKKKKTK